MPFARPTLAELDDQVSADIEASLPGVDALLRYSNLKIMGRAQAGLAYQHYAYLDWIAKQSVPWTATDEYLAAWAAFKNVYQKSAVAWVGVVSWSVSGAPSLPVGTTVVRASDSTQYTTLTAGVISGSTITATVQCNTAGSAGGCAVGQALTLGQSISGIQSTGAVVSTTTTAVDMETETAFRARMLQVYQSRPQGGAQADYVTWALAIPGVTRAWVAPNAFGAGTVTLYTMWDVAESAHGGFPQGTNGVSANDPGPGGLPRGTVATGDQLTVANALITQQPVTALLYSCAPLQNAINFTIAGLLSASAAVLANVTAAIQDVFYRLGQVGGTVVNGVAAGPVDMSDIQSAIAAVAGSEGFIITYPSQANIVSATGYLPVLGTITWA